MLRLYRFKVLPPVEKKKLCPLGVIAMSPIVAPPPPPSKSATLTTVCVPGAPKMLVTLEKPQLRST